MQNFVNNYKKSIIIYVACNNNPTSPESNSSQKLNRKYLETRSSKFDDAIITKSAKLQACFSH